MVEQNFGKFGLSPLSQSLSQNILFSCTHSSFCDGVMMTISEQMKEDGSQGVMDIVLYH
jgi:hypothetical protein